MVDEWDFDGRAVDRSKLVPSLIHIEQQAKALYEESPSNITIRLYNEARHARMECEGYFDEVEERE